MLEMLFDYVKVSEVESEELATSLVFIFSSMGKGHELIQQAIRSSTAHGIGTFPPPPLLSLPSSFPLS